MAIKTNSLIIPESGVTLTNAYTKLGGFSVSIDSNVGVRVSADVMHYANSSSRAANKQPAHQAHVMLHDCNSITGSLASGSFTYVYDKLKLIAPFSGSTMTDV